METSNYRRSNSNLLSLYIERNNIDEDIIKSYKQISKLNEDINDIEIYLRQFQFLDFSDMTSSELVDKSNHNEKIINYKKIIQQYNNRIFDLENHRRQILINLSHIKNYK